MMKNVMYGDNIELVIDTVSTWSVGGKTRILLKMVSCIVAEKTKEDAEVVFNQWQLKTLQAEERYE